MTAKNQYQIKHHKPRDAAALSGLSYSVFMKWARKLGMNDGTHQRYSDADIDLIKSKVKPKTKKIANQNVSDDWVKNQIIKKLDQILSLLDPQHKLL